MKVFKATVLLLAVAATDANAQRNRIIKPVDNLERTTLTGHIHPKATAANDRGRVAASLQMSWVTLTTGEDRGTAGGSRQTPGCATNSRISRLPPLAHPGAVRRPFRRQSGRPGPDHLVATGAGACDSRRSAGPKLGCGKWNRRADRSGFPHRDPSISGQW